MIVTHPLDVLIVNSYAILQFIHKLSVFFSIVDGSKLVTKMRVQLYKIIGDGTSFTSCQNLRRRKEVSLLNNFWLISIHLKVGPRSPSLDSISAKRCSTWELDFVGSVPIAIKYTCSFKVTLCMAAGKHRPSHPPSWIKIRECVSMRDSCFLQHLWASFQNWPRAW